MNLSKTLKKNELKYLVVILLLLLSGCKENSEKSNSDSFYFLSEKPSGTNDFEFLFEQISNLQKQDRLVGAEVLIIRNDTIQLHEVVGWSDKEKGQKLQKNSIYRIRSMTKPIIASAILILMEDGKISLDDKVAKYIPAFNNAKSDNIKIKQLLSHTSGLKSHDFEEIGLSKRPYEFETLREVVDEIGEIGVLKDPGLFYYSGSGIAVLTELITITSGMPAEEFIQRRIFRPLKMLDSYTTFHPDLNWATNLNPAYEWNDSINDFTQYWNASLEPEYKYFRGHGGVYTTAMDYAKFLSMWLNNGSFNDNQILSKEVVSMAQSTVTPLSVTAPFSHQSLAWRVLMQDSTSSKIGFYMHGGSDGTVGMVYPNEHTIALYFNQSRNHIRNIFENLMAITDPYIKYRKWNYNNQFLDQWKEILDSEIHELPSINQIDSLLGKYECISNNRFNSKLLKINNNLILKNINTGFESKLLHLKESEFICWFRPPEYGFLSKITFLNDDEQNRSFTLEWINKKKFKFNKIE
ncbi:serine hydrolase domain-containing protein [Gaetbulibacter sp. M240]|uniref:serine hydrolase domain-containing protein n=1 Tax=Gaetbulibacter sp. M240 TaxID=3126511 RepID=UPI00374E5E67